MGPRVELEQTTFGCFQTLIEKIESMLFTPRFLTADPDLLEIYPNRPNSSRVN